MVDETMTALEIIPYLSIAAMIASAAALAWGFFKSTKEDDYE